MSDSRHRPLFSRRLPASTVLLAMLAPAAAAMSAMDEQELSAVNGQEGLRAVLATPAMTATSVQVRADAGNATAVGGIQADGLTLYPFGGPATLGGTYTLDVGAGSQAALPAIAWLATINRFRLGGSYSGVPTPGNGGFVARASGDPARSFGSWTLVSDLQFELVGTPFYGIPDATTRLLLALNDATLLYQQNWYYHANIALSDLDFAWDMAAGTVDVDTTGLRIAGDTEFRIGFDLLYKFHPDQDMSTVTANDRSLFAFGWNGTLYDSLIYLRSGGVWNTAADAGTGATFAALPTAGRTAGVNVGMRWNYKQNPATNLPGANDFRWRIGHAAGDREYLEFGDWRNLEQATGTVAGRYGFDFPLIVIDALDAGSATNAGGSLCWGNTMTGAACSGGGGNLLTLRAGTVEGYAAAVNRSGGATVMQLIRNGNLLAWSNAVKVGAVNKPALDTNYQWGLIYTLANINSNVYLYPGGSESDVAGGSRSSGVVGDVLFMTQSFGTWPPDNATNSTRWSHGSHFMIADTAAQQGIGLLGASFLVAADDLRLWLKNTWNGQASPYNWEGGVDLFSPRTRAHMRALFGGARLPRGHDLVRGANIDMNFEGVWNFRLSPPPTGADLVAYSAAIRFRCGTTAPFGCRDNAFADATGSTIASGSGSYISIEEPGRAGVDLRFADMSGDVAWDQGVMQLRAADETGTGKPDLTLSNKLLLGASAAARMGDAATGVGLGNGGAAGRAFTSNVQFGGNHVLSWAIPAASMHASFVLMPK